MKISKTILLLFCISLAQARHIYTRKHDNRRTITKSKPEQLKNSYLSKDDHTLQEGVIKKHHIRDSFTDLSIKTVAHQQPVAGRIELADKKAIVHDNHDVTEEHVKYRRHGVSKKEKKRTKLQRDKKSKGSEEEALEHTRRILKAYAEKMKKEDEAREQLGEQPEESERGMDVKQEEAKTEAIEGENTSTEEEDKSKDAVRKSEDSVPEDDTFKQSPSSLVKQSEANELGDDLASALTSPPEADTDFDDYEDTDEEHVAEKQKRGKHKKKHTEEDDEEDDPAEDEIKEKKHKSKRGKKRKHKEEEDNDDEDDDDDEEETKENEEDELDKPKSKHRSSHLKKKNKQK